VALAPFFDRVYGALGRHLSVSRETLERVLGEMAPFVSVRKAELSGNDATIAELAVNLLARLYPRIAIAAPGTVRERLAAIAVGINPSIDILRESGTSPAICIGAGDGDALYPSADGWVAHLRHRPDVSGEHRGNENPFAASAAAAFAAAELFRRLLLRTAAEKDSRLSLLNYSARGGEGEALSDCTLDALYVGVGAVGNGGLWALSRHPRLSGRLTLVDHEPLSLLNLQRYVLGTFADVGRRKVDLGAAGFGGGRVTVEVLAEDFDSYVDRCSGRIPQRAVCVSVDNVDGRRTAQALLPRVVINGWTGEAGLGASWHELANGRACLACIYHPTKPGLSAPEQAAEALGLPRERAMMLWMTREPLTDADLRTIASALGVTFETLAPWRRRALGDVYTDVVCGAVPMDLQGLNKVETVPLAHQSVLAGILMAAELVKRSSPELAGRSQSETLVSWDDVLRAPPHGWARPAASTPGCICGDDVYRAVYSERWGLVPKP
jgi:hypothetical protein